MLPSANGELHGRQDLSQLVSEGDEVEFVVVPNPRSDRLVFLLETPSNVNISTDALQPLPSCHPDQMPKPSLFCLLALSKRTRKALGCWRDKLCTNARPLVVVHLAR